MRRLRGPAACEYNRVPPAPESPTMLRAASAAALALILAQPACASDQPPTADTQHGKVRVVTVAEGLEHPWGVAFLPDGRALVTERPGRLRIVGADGKP